MSNEELYYAIAIAVLLSGSLAFIFWKQRRDAKRAVANKEERASGPSTRQLQLQAYERLILLADRIAIPNLISRLNQQGFTAKEMQAMLTQATRQEFDYNITQQIYVSTEAWEAVRNYKEQNLLIINQVASYLPADATGVDLNKHLLEMIMQNPSASLHGVVAEVLSFEAKKVMK